MTKTETVERLIEQQIDGDIHGIVVTARRRDTVYCLLSQSVTRHGGPATDLRTVVVDLADQKVKVADNGLWVPGEVETLRNMTKLVARTSNDVSDGEVPDEPLTESIREQDVDDLLATEMIPDDYTPDHGWGEDWGNGQGPPPAVHDLVDRLDQADVETDRFSRLDFGAKTPWERYAGRSADDLLGNYGVETIEGDALVVVDVDDPDEAPVDDLPSTYSVTSPHGDDRRAHHYYRVPRKEIARDHFGTSAVKPGWGDVWLSGEYVVGPGSVLDGCGKDHCDDCADPDGGRYEVLDDVPIATLDVDDLIEICEQTADVDDGEIEQDDAQTAAAADGGETTTDDEDDEQDDDVVECARCGAEVPIDETDLDDLGDGPVYVCSGGGCA